MNFTKPLLIALAVGVASPALAQDHLPSVQAGEKVTVISTDGVTLHTFHGISNSHIIETENELRMVDAQMLFPDAAKVQAYIATLDKPLVQVILSHAHPDHWFGAETFAADTAIATSANVAENLAEIGPGYAKSMQDRMGGMIPTDVIVPTQTIALGAQNWDGLDVIVEEFIDQESHVSLMIRLPEQGVMIGQDMFYNSLYLVASDREHNANWIEILQGLETETAAYPTLLVGHGANGGAEILAQDIKYLQGLEVIMAQNLSKEDTKAAVMAAFPELGGESMLDISLRNLFSGH